MDLQGLCSRSGRWRSRDYYHGRALAMGGVVVFFLLLLLTTTTTCVSGRIEGKVRAVSSHHYSRSAYSDSHKRSAPNHLSTVVDQSFSQTHPSRERLQRQTAELWEETKANVRQSGQERRQGQKLNYYYPRVFYVRDNGADPTGVKDSTVALQKTIDEAFEVVIPDPNIPDLGGVEIHLEGGDYLISRPIQFCSKGGGNLRIHGGTIRASNDFLQGRYLLELWSADGQQRRSNSTVASLRDRSHQSIFCLKDYFVSYEDITLRDLMLDSNYRGGGLLLVDTLRINVDNLYFSHFSTDGIFVESSHEVYIQNSYFGDFITSGDPHQEDYNGVAINLISSDNVISNVVIFAGKVGVQISGEGNLLTGVHAYNKAAVYGGVGIYLKSPGYTQTRILNSYLDYTGIVADDPAQLDISHNYFNGDANVILRATREEHSVEDVMIMDNMFAGTWRGINIVELNEKLGAFETVEKTVVDQNTAYGMNLKSTVARATINGYGKKFTVDFSQRLLFKDLIQSVQYSVYVPTASSFTRHVIRSNSDNKVTIELDCRVSGTVTVSVDQSVETIYSTNVS